MAQYLVEVFGESLLVEPLSSHPCEENHPLPSPNLLKNKILIKNKKCDPKSCSKFSQNSPQLRAANHISAQSSDEASVVSSGLLQSIGARGSSSTTSSDENYSAEINSSTLIGSFRSDLPPPSSFHQTRTATEEIDDFSDDEAPCNMTDVSTFSTELIPEAQAIPAMSGLVVYTVPTTYISFQHFANRNRSYEMISLVEDRAKYLQRQHPKDFLAYNQRQFSRIYPRGTRLDSTNFSPHRFWSVGCQLVALNYQTLGTKKKQKKFPFVFEFDRFSFRYSDAIEFVDFFVQWSLWLSEEADSPLSNTNFLRSIDSNADQRHRFVEHSNENPFGSILLSRSNANVHRCETFRYRCRFSTTIRTTYSFERMEWISSDL